MAVPHEEEEVTVQVGGVYVVVHLGVWEEDGTIVQAAPCRQVVRHACSRSDTRRAVGKEAGKEGLLVTGGLQAQVCVGVSGKLQLQVASRAS